MKTLNQYINESLLDNSEDIVKKDMPELKLKMKYSNIYKVIKNNFNELLKVGDILCDVFDNFNKHKEGLPIGLSSELEDILWIIGSCVITHNDINSLEFTDNLLSVSWFDGLEDDGVTSVCKTMDWINKPKNKKWIFDISNRIAKHNIDGSILQDFAFTYFNEYELDYDNPD